MTGETMAVLPGSTGRRDYNNFDRDYNEPQGTALGKMYRAMWKWMDVTGPDGSIDINNADRYYDMACELMPELDGITCDDMNEMISRHFGGENDPSSIGRRLRRHELGTQVVILFKQSLILVAAPHNSLGCQHHRGIASGDQRRGAVGGRPLCHMVQHV